MADNTNIELGIGPSNPDKPVREGTASGGDILSASLICWKCGVKMLVLVGQVGCDVECPHCKSVTRVPEELFGVPRTIRVSLEQRITRKSPATAGILNFFFSGAGYIYAGKQWGWAVFIPFILLNTVLCASSLNQMNADGQSLLVQTLIWLPIDLGLGWHAYHIVKEEQKERTGQ